MVVTKLTTLYNFRDDFDDLLVWFRKSIPQMTWYQDHGESYSYEDLHRLEEIHQPSPEITNVDFGHRLGRTILPS